MLLFQREIPEIWGHFLNTAAWETVQDGSILNSPGIIAIAKSGQNQYSHHSLPCDFTDFLLNCLLKR